MKRRPPDATGETSDLTGFLVAWSNGEESAGGALMDAVYGELRRLARGYLRRERPGHSLPPTALVHEAYLKLVDQRRVRWQNRAHFFAIAAQPDASDPRRPRTCAWCAAKRGGGTVPAGGVRRSGSIRPTWTSWRSTDALEKLARIDPRQSRIVELRFFGGSDDRRGGGGSRRRADHRQAGLGAGPDLVCIRRAAEAVG